MRCHGITGWSHDCFNGTVAAGPTEIYKFGGGLIAAVRRAGSMLRLGRAEPAVTAMPVGVTVLDLVVRPDEIWPRTLRPGPPLPRVGLPLLHR